MGGIEHHDKTGHKVLGFEDKDYTYTFNKTNIEKLHSLFHQLGSDPEVNVNTIVEKTSELLKTCCSLYNRLENQGNSLRTWAACNLFIFFQDTDL